MPSFQLLLVLALAVGFALPSSGSAQFHMEDSLIGGSSMGNPIGGSFGPTGWTVTGVDDRIWYALPRLESGYVEFTVANITPANIILADNEIFAMYEAGYGIAEPIPYAPEFRSNNYKMLIRIYGTDEPSRTGQMKMMWGMCPSGAPGYGGACGCASAGDAFFEEPFDDPGPWTGAPVRIRVEWGGGVSRLLRDGTEVLSVNWGSRVFGPSELHMMIGSPRNDGRLSSMPIGAVFSNLVVDGTMGALAVCSGGGVDAGVVPTDAGVCTGGAVADATAASWEPGVFGDVSDLNVEGSPGSPSAVVYLRFPAVAGPVTSATLTMNTSGVPSAAGGSGRPCRVDGATFDESTLTWATRPMVSAVCAGTARAIGGSEAISWDVRSLIVPGGDITLAIVSENDDGAHYFSREAGGCASGPRLDVVLGPGVDAGPGPDAAGLDAGPAMDSGRPSDGGSGADTGMRRAVGDGCGCTVGSRSPGPAQTWLALLGLALLARRRRR